MKVLKPVLLSGKKVLFENGLIFTLDVFYTCFVLAGITTVPLRNICSVVLDKLIQAISVYMKIVSGSNLANAHLFPFPVSIHLYNRYNQVYFDFVYVYK